MATNKDGEFEKTANEPTKKKLSLKKLKKRVGTGDGGAYSKKGLQTFKKQ